MSHWIQSCSNSRQLSHLVRKLNGKLSNSLRSQCNNFNKHHYYQQHRWISSSKLTIEKTKDESRFSNVMPEKKDLKFGMTMSDHMLMIEWDDEQNWACPKIVPLQDLRLSPAASVLHYGKQHYI